MLSRVMVRSFPYLLGFQSSKFQGPTGHLNSSFVLAAVSHLAGQESHLALGNSETAACGSACRSVNIVVLIQLRTVDLSAM